MKSIKKEGDQSGQFLMEVVIAVAIMLMLTHAFFTLITASYQILGQSRSEVTAKAIANEKMELIRNLPYDQVGTLGGIPSGNILQNDVLIRNGQSYNIATSIQYKDDPFDQLAPSDLLPIDYKLVRIDVSWGGAFPNNYTTTLVTNIAPKGVETTNGGGTLSFLVFDSQGQPVPQANIHIEAPAANPPVDLNLITDNLGTLVLPGAPVCTACYSVTVTKSGYSTNKTYTTSEVANPNNPPLTVLENQVTETSFAIDRLSTATFNSKGTRSAGFPPLGSINFHLQSNKTIGTDTLGDPVYKIDTDFTTDGGGTFSTQLEWDNYILTADDVNHNLGGSNPLSPFPVLAGTDVNLDFVAIPSENNSLLVKVTDSSGTPLSGAITRLYDGIAYDGTLDTGTSGTPDWGQSFFSPLTSGDYNLDVNANGYQPATSNVSVSGPTKETVILNNL